MKSFLNIKQEATVFKPLTRVSDFSLKSLLSLFSTFFISTTYSLLIVEGFVWGWGGEVVDILAIFRRTVNEVCQAAFYGSPFLPPKTKTKAKKKIKIDSLARNIKKRH